MRQGGVGQRAEEGRAAVRAGERPESRGAETRGGGGEAARLRVADLPLHSGDHLRNRPHRPQPGHQLALLDEIVEIELRLRSIFAVPVRSLSRRVRLSNTGVRE